MITQVYRSKTITGQSLKPTIGVYHWLLLPSLLSNQLHITTILLVWVQVVALTERFVAAFTGKSLLEMYSIHVCLQVGFFHENVSTDTTRVPLSSVDSFMQLETWLRGKLSATELARVQHCADWWYWRQGLLYQKGCSNYVHSEMFKSAVSQFHYTSQPEKVHERAEHLSTPLSVI